MNGRILGRLSAVWGALSLAACGGRANAWDAPVGSVEVQRLSNAVSLIDTSLARALMITAQADQTLHVEAVPLGQPIVQTATSLDRSRLFVLSRGQERLAAGTEGPALTVIDQDHLTTPKRYELPDALSSLVIDPAGKFAIVYAASAEAGTFITNPNELIFVDLTQEPGDAAVTRKNLPSNSGGAPRRLTFTPPLHFPAGDRRLLVVETDRDVMLLDPDHPALPEISLPVTDPHSDPRALVPSGVAIDAGDAAAGRPPVVALRTSSDDNVIVYTLGPSNHAAPANDFLPTPNTVFVGGTPSALSFVSTSKGRRLAVLVPGSARLIDVSDNQVLEAPLGAPYDAMSIVPSDLNQATTGSDRVLLWSTRGALSVALWDLSKLPDAVYADIDTLKSIETLNLSAQVTSVLDVADPSLKVLETNGGSLYVLDLLKHTTSPLSTSTQVSLRFARQGNRAWAFEPSQPKLAQIALAGPLVVPVPIDRPIQEVVEIDRTDTGGKALLALHQTLSDRPAADAGARLGAGVAVTVFDAEKPEAISSRRYTSLMLEGLAR